MRMTRAPIALVLSLGLAGVLAADDLAEYRPLMQKVAGLTKELKANLDAGKGPEAANKAAELSTEASKMEKWWAGKGKDDAAKWAANLGEMAEHIASMAKSGDTSGAAGHFKMMTANCGSCHNAHREKGADGKWKIKM